MINIGQYIESAINWMMVHFSTFFDAVNSGIGSFIIGFQHVLFGIPFYITILALAVAAWMKAGRGTAIFTVLGLLLIYGMGFWEATMQTLALVLSSTCLALVVGVPLGIWTANSPRADKILRPVLDLMQTMPAFVYLIPAVLFFGLGAVPGVFATIIFAMPPVVRLTGLGIRKVHKNVVEASRSFAATRWQSTASYGITYYFDRSKSNDNDVTFHGRNRCHDCCRWFRGNRLERYYPNENRFGI